MLQLPHKRIGYTLYDMNTHWEIHTPHTVFRGTLIQVGNFAVETLGFMKKDFEDGVLEMNASFHNSAEFGEFRRSFIYSFDREEYYDKTGSGY